MRAARTPVPSVTVLLGWGFSDEPVPVVDGVLLVADVGEVALPGTASLPPIALVKVLMYVLVMVVLCMYALIVTV